MEAIQPMTPPRPHVDHADILAYIVTETLRAALPAAPHSVAREAARILPGLRAAVGGERHYLRETPPTLGAEDVRRAAIVRDALSMRPMGQICREHGISRRTIYRLIKKYANQPPPENQGG